MNRTNGNLQNRALVDDTLVKFSDGGLTPFLVGGRCGKCGRITVRVRAICPSCWGENCQSEIALPDTGVLFSYTVIHYAPKGFPAPYAVGLIDLPDGLRVFGRVAWSPDQAPRIGSKVKFELSEVSVDENGRTMWGPLFRPVTESGGS